MAKKKTSWREKLNKEQERIIKPIDRDGMGAKAGMIMLIPKPTDVDEVMRQVAHGKLATVATIREYLAKKYEVDFTCPLTTGIFTWIAANAAEEDFAEGKKNITPYWRTLKADGSLNPKYPGGTDAQAERLIAEGHEIIPAKGKKPPKVKDFEKKLQKLN